jgi:hypothetical protein
MRYNRVILIVKYLFIYLVHLTDLSVMFLVVRTLSMNNKKKKKPKTCLGLIGCGFYSIVAGKV